MNQDDKEKNYMNSNVKRLEEAACPLVSVVVPCYNGEKYLTGFLNALLGQNYPAIEVVFVDDGSTDSTALIIQEYKKYFEKKGFVLTYIRSERNKGAAAAINLGLNYVTGTYLMWIDSDDIMLPENIKEKVSFLEKHQEVDCVFCSQMNVEAYDLNKTIGILKMTETSDKDLMISNILHGKNVIYGPGTVLIRQKAFRMAIPSNKIYESRQGQNYQMILPIAYCCKCATIDHALVKYVIHSDSHSHQKRTFKEFISRQQEFIDLVRETLRRIPSITTRDFNRYMYIAEQAMLSKELNHALRYGHLIHYYKTRKKMLKKGLCVCKEQEVVYFYSLRVKRRLNMALNKLSQIRHRKKRL